MKGIIITSKFNPVFPPMFKQQDSSSSGMSYPQASRIANDVEKAEDDIKIQGVSLKTDVKGLRGQREVQINNLRSIDNDIQTLRYQAVNAMSEASSDSERTTILTNMSQKVNQLKSKTLMPFIFAEQLQKDADLLYKDVEDVPIYDSSSPALRLNVGAVLTDKTVGPGGFTQRTAMFARMAGAGMFYTNENGQIVSKGRHLSNAMKNTAVNEDGSPVSYANNRYVLPAKEPEYLKTVSTMMSGTGSSESNKYTVISEGKPIVTDIDVQREFVLNGAGAKVTSNQSNYQQLLAAAGSTFDKLSSDEKNFVVERLVSSGAELGTMKLADGKVIENMSYAEVPSAIKYLTDQLRSLDPAELSGEKAQTLQDGIMKLSRSFLLGMQKQVLADAMGWVKPKLNESHTYKLERASADRTEKLRVAAFEEEMQLINTLGTPMPLSIYKKTDNGQWYLTTPEVKSMMLRSSVAPNEYINRMYRVVYPGSEKIAPTEKTVEQLPLQGIMMAGMFWSKDTPGLSQGYNITATGEIMSGPMVNNGEIDGTNMNSQKWIRVNITLPKGASDQWKLPRITNQGEVTRMSGNKVIGRDTVNMVTNQFESFHDFVSIGINPLSNEPYSKPTVDLSSIKIGKDAKGNDVVSGWIQYDPILENKSTGYTSELIRSIQEEQGKKDDNKGKRNLYGVSIETTGRVLSLPEKVTLYDSPAASNNSPAS